MSDLLTILKYAFLGIVQGITEPLPISSSGHLVIIEHVLGLKIKGLSFEVLMNFASLIAVLILFRDEVFRIVVNSWEYVRRRTPSAKADFNLAVYIVLGTIPVAVLGVLFKDLIESYLKTLTFIGIALIITGIALWVIRNFKGSKSEENLSFKDAMLVGVSQAIALIPGISRSGATIVTALGLGIERETAFRYSFLLYIPVSVGGIVLSISDMFHDPKIHQLLLPYAVAFILSLVMSFYALRWFKEIVMKGKLGYFTVYCLVVGVGVVLYSMIAG
ncbi:undecaprenyl-diphosphate phosphatase [Falsibacillus albus]|uniref:Undecaprenyl-diphosphatase n=1 Tax=Falsibacillus albus TaxID=2478915 RepID=A0A3L7K0Z6_9BACI|nr:undecaprenyl-diphosphate phosphatase [Falsibacillus albus]RLQ96743.1 UDP pyrophosphate phosphatase [Falsibacillus albus]